MAHAHNGFLRALNSIYLQCPAVSAKKDVADLLTYCALWQTWMSDHHRLEETILFPAFEKSMDSPGLMSAEHDQHEAMQPGLVRLGAWVRDCQAGKEEFEATKLRAIIDSFGEKLAVHFEDEIPTILKLDSEKCDLAILKKGHDDFEAQLFKTDLVCACCVAFFEQHLCRKRSANE